MKAAFAALVLVATSLCTHTWAQQAPTADTGTDTGTATTTVTVPSTGIQSQNIFEVRPSASEDPNYLSQSNGERERVQPGNNAPLWRDVGAGVNGFSSLPHSQAPEAGNLIQPFVQYPGSRYASAGEAWRQTRNHWVIPYGAALLFLALLAIALFYFSKGPIRLDGPLRGRLIERFTYFERAAHWSTALTFSILALSGIVIAFGKFFLLPVLGGAVFGWLTWFLKTTHNFIGPLFVVSLVVLFFTFVRDNWPARVDLMWLRKGGGLLSGEHVPSNRFNAGEKILFWGGIFFLGLLVSSSGLVLDRVFPGLDYLRGSMQIAHLVHAVAALLMMAMFIGHIYLGSIGQDGALKAMQTGYVDEAWAEQHHALWYQDIQSGKIPSQRSAVSSPTAPSVNQAG